MTHQAIWSPEMSGSWLAPRLIVWLCDVGVTMVSVPRS
jgi:hypothetical protein